MLTYEDALKKILTEATAASENRRTEYVPLEKSFGRILAQNITTDLDLPPFDTSLMDGYACRRADLQLETLTVVDTVMAGSPTARKINSGECVKIMTGGCVPEGADTVIIIEETSPLADNKIKFLGTTKTPAYIAHKGNDFKQGAPILTKGERILPRHMAALAATGNARLPVAESLRVGVLSTGNELVEPSEKPGHGQIRNTNSYQIIAQLQALSLNPNYYGIARDTRESLNQHLERAFAENQVIILSGGVSVSEYDLVPQALAKLGVETVLHKIAIKPGKPLYFGKTETHFVFGLPGKPASSFTVFELFVKPFLYQLMGHAPTTTTLRLPLAKNITREPSARAEFIPVKIENTQATPTTPHQACGLITLPPQSTGIKAGETVEIKSFD
jgi:molybdopterin molybdotransferase